MKSKRNLWRPLVMFYLTLVGAILSGASIVGGAVLISLLFPILPIWVSAILWIAIEISMLPVLVFLDSKAQQYFQQLRNEDE